MRHRKKGRKLGRNPKHQRALLRSLATALILTERDPDYYVDISPGMPKAPAVSGRIVTTLPKAKEVRPLVERCVTIAKRALEHQDAADELEPDADRDSQEWQNWRNSPQWNEWNQVVAPAVTARRRLVQILGSKEAVRILFDEIAPRYVDRPGGYTRILRLATLRLGDAGIQAILEFVGKNDREKIAVTRPTFADDEVVVEEVTVEPVEDEEPQAEDATEDNDSDDSAEDEKAK